jgi:hypothetical protein
MDFWKTRGLATMMTISVNSVTAGLLAGLVVLLASLASPCPVQASDPAFTQPRFKIDTMDLILQVPETGDKAWFTHRQTEGFETLTAKEMPPVPETRAH